MSLPINIAAMNHGLPPVGPGVRETFCAGDYVIHPDIPDLYQLRPLPAGHQCIGPLNWSPEIPPPIWWNEVPDDKPIVYVNLGSSGEPASLDAIIAALMELPVTVMVATTNRRTIASVPGKVFVAEYLQGEAAAARSHLMINNAGASSGYQALAAGVPFLGIPSNADQLVFMRCMTRTGAGICILENDVTSAAVKDAIAHMLATPSFAATARAIKTKIAAVDTPAIIVKLIDDILASRLRNAG
jgi:UDP:flavonoid glycosyltransferase YjiC (YdhE family)